MLTDSLPRPGDIARVRHRQYLVDEVQAASGVRDTNTLVRLTCLDDDAQGRPLSVLWALSRVPKREHLLTLRRFPAMNV